MHHIGHKPFYCYQWPSILPIVSRLLPRLHILLRHWRTQVGIWNIDCVDLELCSPKYSLPEDQMTQKMECSLRKLDLGIRRCKHHRHIPLGMRLDLHSSKSVDQQVFESNYRFHCSLWKNSLVYTTNSPFGYWSRDHSYCLGLHRFCIGLAYLQ